MLRSAVQSLLLCAAVLMWGSASGRGDVFIAGEAPELGWSAAGELSEENKHGHDSPAGTIDPTLIEFVGHVDAAGDHALTCTSLGGELALQLRGPPCV